MAWALQPPGLSWSGDSPNHREIHRDRSINRPRVRRLAALAFLMLSTAAGVLAQTAADPGASFDWDQRWNHYLYRTYSWQRMGYLAVDSTFDYLTGDARDCDRSAAGYGCRFGSNLGSRIVRNSIELGAGAMLHEDTRFRPSGAKTFGARIRYATLSAFEAYRGEERRFAYSRLAATLGGVVAVSLWRGRGVTPWRLAQGIEDSYASHLENSFLTEFSDDLKGLGRKVWKAAVSK